jgi:predicted dehydrogenase
MGNQGHADEGTRQIREWVEAGAIGTVREVQLWTNRPIWPQAIDRPLENLYAPAWLDWDLWLGPVAERPYHSAYAPFRWRGWWDFGTGALGDMGCHIIDHPVWALQLGPPDFVEARITHDGSFLDGNEPNFETYPIASIIYYEFPARGELPPVHMTWYDGGLMPPAPSELPLDQRLPDNGVLYVGSNGKMYHSSHGGMPQLLPRELHDAAKAVPQTIARSPGHYDEWIAACKGGPRPVSNFDYAGPMTETVLLGVLALRSPGRRLAWDSEQLKVKNAPELNQYVHTEYRTGWTL